MRRNFFGDKYITDLAEDDFLYELEESGYNTGNTYALVYDEASVYFEIKTSEEGETILTSEDGLFESVEDAVNYLRAFYSDSDVEVIEVW